MTKENRLANARDELQRADECLREAEALAGAGLPYGAASRAYYVVFHAARALLFSVGLETKTHSGIVSLLGDHFVKPGHLSPELGRLVSRMQRDREDADYLSSAVFTDQEARRSIAFLAAARKLVSQRS